MWIKNDLNFKFKIMKPKILSIYGQHTCSYEISILHQINLICQKNKITLTYVLLTKRSKNTFKLMIHGLIEMKLGFIQPSLTRMHAKARKNTIQVLHPCVCVAVFSNVKEIN